jgi:hypothetical protein
MVPNPFRVLMATGTVFDEIEEAALMQLDKIYGNRRELRAVTKEDRR